MAPKPRRQRNGHRYRRLRDLVIALYDSCHLCGHRVNKCLSGKHKLGPTLDHVIPVDLGGPDTLENSRLAHNKCNASRGAMPIEQWRATHPIRKAW